MSDTRAISASRLLYCLPRAATFTFGPSRGSILERDAPLSPSLSSSMRSLLLLALAISVAKVTSAQTSIEPAERYAAVARNVSALVEHERAQKGIPAIAIALVDGQRVVWARGFGWADSSAHVAATAQTVFRVGSVSKLFTDVAIMKLVEHKRLDLDVPVQRYLPDFHPRNPFGGEITIRELTSHRAGLTREPPVGNYFDDTSPSLAATIASLNSTTLVYKPGTHTKYSNAGIAVLGYVLEKTQRESFYPYLERAVLAPMGMTSSAFQPVPALQQRLAKAYMWTLDGRQFEAPTFQLGMGPCGSMYSTVLDLSRFLGVLFAGGTTPDGKQVLAKSTLDSMWTPQFSAPGATAGFGIGFNIGRLDGRRTIGHGGAIYGFATTLLALPDDSLGVVVIATLDAVNAVTDHIGETALRELLALRQGRAVSSALDTTSRLAPGEALAVAGRYTNDKTGVDLQEYEGRLLMTPLRGGFRGELRRPARGPGSEPTFVMDDRLALGARVDRQGDRIVIGRDTLVHRPALGSDIVPMAEPKPDSAPGEYSGLVGEYGWDHDVLYIREKDGRLNALIEWFFEYPLERVSRDVYAFPKWGLYDGQTIEFRRGTDGKATVAIAGTVPFKRRALPGDDDRVNFKITPVRPVEELRKTALAASPPTEGPKRPSDLVEVRGLDSTIRYDIRYATSNNFMGTPFYSSAHAFMQRPAAEAVARASAHLRKLGYGLLIHDAYRPWYVTKMFWDGTPPDKHVFVADPSQGSRHNRGCAVDLTLYDLATGRPIRMTGGYDEMTDRSYPLYPGGTSLQRWHRDLLRHAMEAQGFNVYEAEWWHFDFGAWREYPIGTATFEQLVKGTGDVRPEGSAAGRSSTLEDSVYDVVIRNGRVLDGMGNPWIAADVGISNGRFARIGKIRARGHTEIDATGKYVSPGWIDMMDQSGSVLPQNGLAENKLREGVTTAIGGEGGTPVPAARVGEYFARLERQGISINFGSYFSETQARVAVLGQSARAPNAAELAAMRAIVDTAMRGGAMGMTTALIYPPSSYSTTSELIEVGKAAAKYGGTYASHIRGEGKEVVDAVREAVAVGEGAGMPVEIFHLKVAHRPAWGILMDSVRAVVDAARARGVDVAADLYVYTAGGTGLEATIPSWAHEGGVDSLRARLANPQVRARLKRELTTGSPGWWNIIEAAGGWDGIVLVNARNPDNAKYEQKTIAQIARETGKDPADAAWDIVAQGRGRVMAIYHMMGEQDIATALGFPWTSIGSDAGAILQLGAPDETGLPHPRSFGNFPRVIARYVKERPVLTLPEAIRKMTGWPATRMRLANRGTIQVGNWADVTIFDLDSLKDLATYEKPMEFPSGIEWVLVNGVVTIDHGRHTGAKAGRVLWGPGRAAME
jgi:N-acyl-D-aspartate/D-glutamate deacylase/CubicO group peptidase (beta-lactamase class C family)/D-alanyl-D-alanine dipeptidase